MNLKTLSIIAASSLLFAACGGEAKHEHTEGEAHEHATAEPETFAADIESSNVHWTGEVKAGGVSLYSHNGDVKLKSGSITLAGDAITGGEFVIDLTTIAPANDSSYHGKGPGALLGHLTTGDFFLVDSFPTANFVIKSVEGATVTGDLTVRDKTNEETITIETVTNEAGEVTAKGQLVFDRQKYDVKWVHYEKDMLLADDITLDIALVAKK